MKKLLSLVSLAALLNITVTGQVTPPAPTILVDTVWAKLDNPSPGPGSLVLYSVSNPKNGKELYCVIPSDYVLYAKPARTESGFALRVYRSKKESSRVLTVRNLETGLETDVSGLEAKFFPTAQFGQTLLIPPGR